jgi:hypothetical protein
MPQNRNTAAMNTEHGTEPAFPFRVPFIVPCSVLSSNPPRTNPSHPVL